MSFSNSNETQKLKSIGRALKDLHSFTKDHSKQVCERVKSTEILSSIKSSGNKSLLSSTRGRVKHESLEDEDDESLLWKNDEDQQQQRKSALPTNQIGNAKTNPRFGFGILKPNRSKLSHSSRSLHAYQAKPTVEDSIGQDDIFDLPRKSRGIRFPFLK